MIRRTLNAVRQHPYYIYANDYRRTSAGVRVLHMLCDALVQSGHEAYVFANVRNPRLRTPALTPEVIAEHRDLALEPIAIYPEVIDDNPLKANVAVRYLLNKPGLLAGSGVYGKDDLRFAYARQLVQPGMPVEDVLHLPAIDLNIFRPSDDPGKRIPGKTCYYLGRKRQGTIPPGLLSDDAIEITQSFPDSWEALADIFQQCEYFYAADITGMTGEAALCGCVSIFVPNEWTSHKFGQEESLGYGVSWGLEPELIDTARRTLPLVRERAMEQEGKFWPQLDHFIEATQQHAGRILAQKRALNAIARKHIAVLSAEPPIGPCPYIRFSSPFGQLEQQWQISWPIQERSLNEDFLRKCDLIVFQRYTPGLLPQSDLDRIFALGKPVIYETDDLLHDVPDYHPQAASARQWKAGIEYAARHARAVVVSTPYLADKLKALNANVHVLPNFIDYNLLYRAPTSDQGRKLHIGMVGTSLQGPNFALVDQALRTLLAEYPGRIKLFFVGWAPPAGWENHPDTEFHPVIASYLDYAALLKDMALDIALVPLADDEFNYAKTPIKWLEYASAGIAAIFSDVSIYRDAVTDGKTGLLAGNAPQAWLDALHTLVDAPERRMAIALAAQQEVHERHDVSTGALEYGRVYASLLQPASGQQIASVAATPPVTDKPQVIPRPATSATPKGIVRPMTPGRRIAASATARPTLPPPLAQAEVPAPVPIASATPVMPPPADAPASKPAAAPNRPLRVAVCSVESTWSPCPQIRLILPFGFMGKQWELEWAIKDGRFDRAVLDRADIIVLHRFTPGLLPQSDLETLLGGKQIVVYETDDLLNDIPDYHPQAADSRKWKPGIEYTVRHARAVTVSTPFLADKYRALNSHIHVLPNYLDFDRFYRPTPVAEGEHVTIGLLGTSITGPNFELVNNALRVLCHRYPDRLRLHLVGWECPAEWQDHPAVRYEPFIHAYQDYAAKLLEWNWDIALVPLVDDDFNHSKSAIKYLEYAAAGIATAFSDVVVYNKVVEDGRTGLLVEQSQGAWLQAIESLLKDAPLRRRLARTAQADVRKHHSLHENAWRYEQAYREIAGLAPQPHTAPARAQAILLLDRAGDAAQRDAALARLDNSGEGKPSWLPKVVLTSQQGELPEGSDQLRFVQFAAEEFDAALALLAAHEDFDWYSIEEV